MKDIVERLREGCDCTDHVDAELTVHGWVGTFSRCLFCEAADEIVRLREAERRAYEKCAEIADEFAAIYCAPAGSGYSYGYMTGKKEAGMTIAKAIRSSFRGSDKE